MAVAIIGRPNVGKSSLFNRIIGRRKAIVWNRPGVTRDLIRDEWDPEDQKGVVELWDLAGWGNFGYSLKNLDKEFIKKIELVLLVVDGSEPLTAEDHECISAVRKLQKPYIVIVNKSDKRTFDDNAYEAFNSFKTDVFFISAEEGEGVGEIKDEILKRIKNRIEKEVTEEAKTSRKVLILGRPNVGKSTLMNHLAGKTIAFVSELSGTTRDLIQETIPRKNVNWVFNDSAGIRRKPKLYGKNSDPVEIFSAGKALKELKKTDYAVFLIEAQKNGNVKAQDRKLLNLIRGSFIPSIILVNKWDLYKKLWTEKDYKNEIKLFLGDLNYIPILFVSAKTGFHTESIFQLLTEIDQRRKLISTSRLNKWLQATMDKRSPRIAKKGVKSGKIRTQTQYLKFHYAVHTNRMPMCFQIFCNAPQSVADDDKRFLINNLRREFSLQGIPVKVVFRRKT